MAMPALGPYPGSYTSSNGGSGTGTVVVAAASPSAPHQLHISLNSSQGSEDNVLEWRPDGVYLISTRLSSPGGQGVDCVWSPSILDLQLPLSVGLQWSSDSSCPISSPYGSGTFREQTTSKVTGTSSLTIGGKTAPVYTIDVQSRLTFDSTAIAYGATSTGTDWLAPGYGLDVREARTTTADNRRGSSTFTLQLNSLTPS